MRGPTSSASCAASSVANAGVRVARFGGVELAPQRALQRQYLAEQLAQRIGFRDELRRGRASRRAANSAAVRTGGSSSNACSAARAAANRRRAPRCRRRRDTSSTSAASASVRSRINAVCCGSAFSSSRRTPRAMQRDGGRARAARACRSTRPATSTSARIQRQVARPLRDDDRVAASRRSPSA